VCHPAELAELMVRGWVLASAMFSFWGLLPWSVTENLFSEEIVGYKLNNQYIYTSRF
jgi:hypothetical protein